MRAPNVLPTAFVFVLAVLFLVIDYFTSGIGTSKTALELLALSLLFVFGAGFLTAREYYGEKTY